MKRILLAGAGHAHLVVLRDLAKSALYGARISVVAPQRRQVYSGMLPGLIAGHYDVEETQVDVAGLAARAYAEFVEGTVVALDPARRVARLATGAELPYDVASLNVGTLTQEGVPGGRERALPVKPFEAFLSTLHGEPVSRVAIAGAGAAGIELAMALRHRGVAVTLYSNEPADPSAPGRRAERAMRRMRVDYRPGMPMTAIEPGPVVISGAACQEFDLVLLATGPAAFDWPQASGLLCDAGGFVRVDATLRSLSHPEVFAAGDCATLSDAPHPKSGVYSVRHGEVLARNLRSLMNAEPLAQYAPQRRALLLLTCGRRYAIAARGGWSAEGAWAWRWKNWIDRRWMKSLAG